MCIVVLYLNDGNLWYYFLMVPVHFIYICASIYDCNNETFDWRYNLKTCVVSGPASFDSNQQCDTTYFDYWTRDFVITLFNNNTINSSEVILSI